MKTIYVKRLSGGPERIDGPVYLYRNPVSGQVQRCHRVKARGILSPDGSARWQLEGKEAIPGTADTVRIITRAEYDELVAALAPDPDPELTDAQALAIMMGGSHETE